MRAVLVHQIPAIAPGCPTPTVSAAHKEKSGKTFNWVHVSMDACYRRLGGVHVQDSIHLVQFKNAVKDHIVFKNYDPIGTREDFRDS